MSLVEATVSTLTGYIISFGLWQFVGPMLGYHVTLWDNFWITNIFTIVSILRQYVWRRFFNARLHEVAVGFVRKAAQ